MYIHEHVCVCVCVYVCEYVCARRHMCTTSTHSIRSEMAGRDSSSLTATVLRPDSRS